ncbi:MAG: glycosyltransferase [Candidatus Shapirobacteria bacterium]|jgi:glycosyltransferase involved in cell wall biosynthesis
MNKINFKNKISPPFSREGARRADGFRIAIVQDYIKEFGGAESVLETLSDIFPDAPIFTSIYKPAFLGPHQSRLRSKWDHRIHQSFFKYIPFAYKIISPLRIFSPLAFKSFDFSKFDVIITSATGAYFPNSLNKKSAKLICYCHTPPRYLYGLPTARNFTKNKFIKFLVAIINHYLRLLDFKFAQNVDQFVANSHTTATRIQKFYRRDAIVINPPVNIPPNLKSPLSKEETADQKEIYYLAGGRLARAKRFDIAIEACKLTKVKLKIFGRDFANYEFELKKMANSNIEFLGEVDNETKSQLYQNAQAFIFPADQEDFGIVPVESMSYGCPVIAYKSGGVTETVIDNKTGVFFDELTGKSCAQAIQTFQKLKIKQSDCVTRASEFGTDKFIQKIKKLILSP